MTTLEEGLIQLGFGPKGRITNSYELSITRSTFRKVISVAPNIGNQYVYIIEGVRGEPRLDDDIVTVYNSDYDGELSIEWIKQLKDLLWKEKK